jgi:hypothetical protein
MEEQGAHRRLPLHVRGIADPDAVAAKAGQMIQLFLEKTFSADSVDRLQRPRRRCRESG